MSRGINGRLMARMLIGAAILLVLILAAIALIRGLLNPAVEIPPEVPPSLATIQTDWVYPILLPTAIPDCFSYAASGNRVEEHAEARGGLALVVRFAPSERATCHEPGRDADLTLTEAPALDSLQGNVTTLSGTRGQYARLAVPDENGRTRLILQWHCGVIMCRVAGNTSAVLSEQDLLQMADSVRQAAL